MHEMSIAQSLVEILQDEMVKHHAQSLKSVTLHIGQLSAIVPESLSFCFEVITSGTNMEGAKLQTEIIPLKARCLDCESVFEIENYAFHCSHCGSVNLDMESGRDLSIIDMEVV